MTNQANRLYALDLEQSTTLIGRIGHNRTVLLQGDIGNGKSSTIHTLAEMFPTHTPCYFDCTTKDLGDITIPNIAKLDDGTGYVTYLTNEELGAHHNKPIILMIDEFGKANTAVKNALLRLMLERKIGSYSLHPDSIVYATTNKGSEGVGDLLQAHQCNRICLVQVRKSSPQTVIEYGVNNGWDASVLGWLKDNDNVLQPFEDVKDPEENPYIFHPRAQRTAFVTPRSLEAASDILKEREHLDDITLTAALIGTIGDRGATDLMSFVKLADQLPTLQSIKDDPKNAKVPDSASAICLVVYRTLANIDRDWINAWMDYLPRLDTEAQGLFAQGVVHPKYSKGAMVMQNKKFTDWARVNNYMLSADKK